MCRKVGQKKKKASAKRRLAANKAKAKGGAAPKAPSKAKKSS